LSIILLLLRLFSDKASSSAKATAYQTGSRLRTDNKGDLLIVHRDEYGVLKRVQSLSRNALRKTHIREEPKYAEIPLSRNFLTEKLWTEK
jgi:hypothetical protein